METLTRPHVAARHRANREIVLQEVQFMLRAGESYPEIARRLGYTHDSLARMIARWRAKGWTNVRFPYPNSNDRS
jgi:transposase